ncbi:MAG: MmcQ/YjbR family DNA-binding protein [Spirosomataceae bacterium]
MNLEQFREYCLAKKGVTEELPFGPGTLVFKVVGKMFALTGLDSERLEVNLKYDADEIEELRAQYPHHVFPGYHMSKKHWNTVKVNGTLNTHLLVSWIDTSYELVVNSLPKKLQEELKGM